MSDDEAAQAPRPSSWEQDQQVRGQAWHGAEHGRTWGPRGTGRTGTRLSPLALRAFWTAVLTALHLLPISQWGPGGRGRGATLPAHLAGLPGLCPLCFCRGLLTMTPTAAITASPPPRPPFQRLPTHGKLESPRNPPDGWGNGGTRPLTRPSSRSVAAARPGRTQVAVPSAVPSAPRFLRNLLCCVCTFENGACGHLRLGSPARCPAQSPSGPLARPHSGPYRGSGPRDAEPPGAPGGPSDAAPSCRTWYSVWWPCRWSGPRAPQSPTLTAQPGTSTRCWARRAAWPSAACAA